MTHIILIWFFPFYLIAFEIVFRGLSGLDTTAFIGPTIATAGLSFLLPLTKPKNADQSVHPRTAAAVADRGGVIVTRGALAFIPLVWIAILVGFLVWFLSCKSAMLEPKASVLFVPKHVAIGAVNYLVAALFSGIKKAL